MKAFVSACVSIKEKLFKSKHLEVIIWGYENGNNDAILKEVFKKLNKNRYKKGWQKLSVYLLLGLGGAQRTNTLQPYKQKA